MNTIVVWAGDDIFTIEREDEFNQQEILRQAIRDFGEGTKLVRTDRFRYEINVDDVEIEPM